MSVFLRVCCFKAQCVSKMVQQRQNEAIILVSTAEIVVSSSWGSDFVATRWMSENQSHETFMIRKGSMTRMSSKYQF
jgi:hypothetical protein